MCSTDKLHCTFQVCADWEGTLPISLQLSGPSECWKLHGQNAIRTKNNVSSRCEAWPVKPVSRQGIYKCKLYKLKMLPVWFEFKSSLNFPSDYVVLILCKCEYNSPLPNLNMLWHFESKHILNLYINKKYPLRKKRQSLKFELQQK